MKKDWWNLVGALVLFMVSSADAAEIKLIASNAVKEAYVQLVPQFEKSTGHRVTISWGGTADIIKRTSAGEVADIVITTNVAIDDLIKQGHLASRTDLVKSVIGVAIRPGTPKPDLSSGEGFKKSLLASKAIILSAGPSGVYLSALFQKMGIADQLKGKMKMLIPGASPGESLAHGEGDIGFTQVSELLAIKGIEFLGPVPADFQGITIFSAGLHKNAPQAEAAKALLKFLTLPGSKPILIKTGMEPA